MQSESNTIRITRLIDRLALTSIILLILSNVMGVYGLGFLGLDKVTQEGLAEDVNSVAIILLFLSVVLNVPKAPQVRRNYRQAPKTVIFWSFILYLLHLILF